MLESQKKLIDLELLKRGTLITGWPGFSRASGFNVEEVIIAKIVESPYPLLYLGKIQNKFSKYWQERVFNKDADLSMMKYIDSFLKKQISVFIDEELVNVPSLIKIIQESSEQLFNQNRLYIFLDSINSEYNELIQKLLCFDNIIFIVKTRDMYDELELFDNVVIFDEALNDKKLKFSRFDTDEEAMTDDYLDDMYDDYEEMTASFRIGSKTVTVR